MFKIHEFSSAAGELSSVSLRVRANDLEIVSEDGVWALPENAIGAVLSRFGAPFDRAARVSVVATFELPEGGTLRHVRHLAGYDVIARDYIVFEHQGQEALCALAATVAAALLHLARAASRAQ